MRPAASSESDSQGLRALSRGILGEAQAEANQILGDARAKADSVRQTAHREAEAKREAILQQARRELASVHSQARASAQSEAQKLRLQFRERLLSEVFTEVQATFQAVPQWPDYPQLLHGWISQAVMALGVAEIVLRADAETQAHLSDSVLADLSQELGARLQLGQPLTNGVGIVAETPDGHRRYPNTLEARLQRAQDRLRAPVYRLLMKGSP